MKTYLGRTGLLACLGFCGLLTAPCGMEAALNPVQWKVASVPQKTLKAGASFTVKLLSRIDNGWHLYALDQEEGGPVAAEIGVADGSFLTLEAIHPSKPIRMLDPTFNKRVSIYVDQAEFGLAMKIGSDPPAGTQHTSIHIRYQCCDATMCLPPRTAVVDFPVDIKATR